MRVFCCRGFSSTPKWVKPVKAPLLLQESVTKYDSEMKLLVAKRERELQKLINMVKFNTLGPRRRNTRKKKDIGPVVKKMRVRSGFIDRLKIKVYPGKGGNGVVAFDRGPHKRVGPPSGGNAGRGGNVYVVVDGGARALSGIPRQVRAGNGQDGGTKKKTGKDGESVYIKVPPGTVVSAMTQEKPDDSNHDDDDEDDDIGEGVKLAAKKNVRYQKLYDLDKEGEQVLLAEGGKGGKGNAHFVSSTNRSPQEASNGETPENKAFLLELKSIADVGLVGFPNAGKSSFLYTVSESSPKISSYQFTTLFPSVGFVRFNDFSEFSVCDIPGIIEGAHKNKGLGHEFLRHIERTQVLAFVVDVSDLSSLPSDKLKILMNELNAYDPKLIREKRCVVIANKIDLEDASKGLADLEQFVQQFHNMDFFKVSLRTKKGLEELLLNLREKVLASSKD